MHTDDASILHTWYKCTEDVLTIHYEQRWGMEGVI